MKVCKQCGEEFPGRIIIDGIERNLQSRKLCLECSPFGKQPGAKSSLSTNNHRNCKSWGKPLEKRGRIFCSINCQHDYEYKEFIKSWKERRLDGGIGETWISVSKHIRRYLFEKYDGKCSRCGWSEMNPYTGTIPLEVEHIDGDAENNSEDNLTLLCPNCHSLTKTYRGANRGKSTRNIKWVSRSGVTC